jgi:hypothetical protein
MSFQEDFALVAQLAARDGKALPDVLSVPVEKQEVYMQIIRETAADLRAGQAKAQQAAIVFDMKLAHAIAALVETTVREKPLLTPLREDMLTLPGIDGFMTIVLTRQDDDTITWLVNNVMRARDQTASIGVYCGTIGVDGVSHARMHLDTDAPVPMLAVTR